MKDTLKNWKQLIKDPTRGIPLDLKSEETLAEYLAEIFDRLEYLESELQKLTKKPAKRSK